MSTATTTPEVSPPPADPAAGRTTSLAKAGDWARRAPLLPALIFVILTIVAAVMLSKTILGRYALAIGSNEEATRLSGINVKFWLIMVYVTAGVFMAMGAVLYSARFGFVQPAEGLGFELQVIAAVVIGGTSLAGGRANIIGTLVGALLMNTLSTGLQMMGLAQQWQLVVVGVVVLIAVFADNVRRSRAAAV